MGNPVLIGALVVGIVFLALAAVVGRSRNKNKTKEQRLHECFEEYDRKMDFLCSTKYLM